ncbi:BtrH N-terminal domain-containing protein [Micromonospora lutea]|uniref:Butirosin biosynthesis protein H N-terminal domain-containing protein n=1 Tax=Micromonospora lutea TaxID=419825 RepID=A0ABQ4IT37_9ACTN|nr:BtrH N-terminal domain-containing protein [Micromonospora lutea]GIJ21047.1 hypothetical protein Vlu01_16710 [Micromonospora lutea]
MPRQGAYDNGLDCFADTYTVLLRDLGVDARVLGDEWGYRYLPAGPATDLPFTRFQTRQYTYPDSVRRWYGIEERCVTHTDPVAQWDAVRDGLSRGRAVGINVDTFHYRPSLFYQRIHHLHRVVVQDWNADRVYVCDDLPGNPFQGWIQIDELNAAVGSAELAEGFAWAGGACCTIELCAPTEVRPPTTGSLRAALDGNVREYLTGSDGSEQPTGEHAVRRFLADIRAFAETEPQLGDALVVQGVTFFGTMAKQRRQNALFVEMVGDRLDVDLGEIGEGFRETSYRLDKLRAVFFYGVSAKRPTRKFLTKLADSLEETFAAERADVLRLAALVN